MAEASANDACPCGSGRPFAACCGRFLDGDEYAGSAEELMRSRYCAFVRRNAPYLLATWHPDFRPRTVRFDPLQRWLGLKIVATEAGGADDDSGIVEFVARSKRWGRGQRLHEVSRFEKLDGRWYYCEGEFR